MGTNISGSAKSLKFWILRWEPFFFSNGTFSEKKYEKKKNKSQTFSILFVYKNDWDESMWNSSFRDDDGQWARSENNIQLQAVISPKINFQQIKTFFAQNQSPQMKNWKRIEKTLRIHQNSETSRNLWLACHFIRLILFSPPSSLIPPPHLPHSRHITYLFFLRNSRDRRQLKKALPLTLHSNHSITSTHQYLRQPTLSSWLVELIATHSYISSFK